MTSDGVVLYLRVSTEDQDLEGQKRELLAYASTRGWTPIGAYEEKTSASGKVVRVEHERLLSDAEVPDRGWRHVLVWSIDRWSREPSLAKAVGSIEQLEALGIAFHSFKEPWVDSTKDGEMSMSRDLVRAVLTVISNFESRRRSERTQLAMDEIHAGRRRTRSGRPPGRPKTITPEVVARIAELREQRPRPKWKDIAIRLKIPAGTCRKAYSTLRRETPSAINGPGGFVARTTVSPEVGSRAR